MAADRARTARTALAGLLALVAVGPGRGRAQQPAEEAREIRSFSILDTRYARARHDEARAHVQAQRWSDAIVVLQKLIEEHRAEVLRLPDDHVDAQGRTSMFPVHVGAADAARQMLLALPPQARRLYAERFGEQAQELLAQARAAEDRRALVDLARRYPLTPAARSAWWSLGDLELESGDAAAARAAWERARELAEAGGVELGPGAQQRLGLELPPGLARGGAASAVDPVAGALRGSPPAPDGHSWRLRIDDGGTPNPFNVAAAGEGYNLLPVLAGDLLFVSNSMRLFAVDAWSGNPRWRSAEPPGWDEVDAGRRLHPDRGAFKRSDFFEAVDRGSVLIAPAVGGDVVVAALQIPVSQIGNMRFQNIPITRVIPDRRLFAFDRESGRPLWNHMPPPLWDGESGSFSERMRVAGPPVIAGSRVLVPTYRMQGRVDYHVACYELASGALLWSTALISGQLPLNMFGRHQQEFAAAPLVVAGDRVVALTQLGSVAALDLYTGDVLWETFYDQIPLPPNEHQYSAQMRRQVWKNAAPAIVEGTVVATPLDSTDLIGLDLEQGTLLWALPHDAIPEPRWSEHQLALVGAAPGVVWLAGPQVIACRSSMGLGGRRPPIDLRHSAPLAQNVIDADRLPRTALGAATVVAATPARRVVLDREDLRYEDRRLSGPWGSDQGPGNVLLGEGALFTLSSKYLTGCFDWEMLERRYQRELEARPDDPHLVASYAHFLVRRAGSELGASRLNRALELCGRARALLEPRLGDSAPELRAELRAELFAALRLESEVRVRQADSAAAVALLQRAAELAPDAPALRDTLLALASLQRARREGPGLLATLERLEERCGSLALPEEVPAALPSSALQALVERSERGTPVALWTLEQRAGWWREAGEVGAELEELHRVLARYGDVTLGPREAGERASARIRARLDAPGGRAAYAPFEQRARAQLERALESGDVAALERLAELFPHSAAAADAAAARLEAAWSEGDVALYARLVQRQLPADLRPQAATPEQTTLLLRLGALLEAHGNAELMRALLRRLGALHPDHPVDLGAADPRTGRALGEVAAAAALAPDDELATGEPFDAAAASSTLLEGDHALLGSLGRGEGDGAQRTWVLARREGRRDVLVALSGADPTAPAWEARLERGGPLPMSAGRCHVAGNRVVVLGPRSPLDEGPSIAHLVAYDGADGTPRWSWASGVRAIESLTGASGVVVATLQAPDRSLSLAALDVAGGVRLWERPLESGLFPTPVCGEGRLVLLPSARGERARVLDLFTGREAASFDPGEPVGDADQRGAWTQGALLVLPSFPKTSPGLSTQQTCLSAWDLDRGVRAWSVPLESGRELDSIVRHGDAAYLLFLASSGAAGSQAGVLLQVDLRLGAHRAIENLRLGPEDDPVGIRRHTVVELAGPYLFLRSPAQGRRETLVRAVHLPYGERWVVPLPLSPDDYNAPMPLPALTSGGVALAFTESPRSRGGPPQARTSLLVLDAASGVRRDSRLLADALGRADDLQLVPLGSALLVRGREALLVLAR